MRIAYIILVHKNPEQVVRLVDRLDNSNTLFIIHIDLKSAPFVHQKMHTHLVSKSNVYFCKPKKVYWGDFSQVSVTLACIKELLKNQLDYDYCKLLSGQDYPLKSASYIQAYLQQHRGKEFIENFALPYVGWIEGGDESGGMDRINYHYLFKNDSRTQLGFVKRRFPYRFQPFAGSSLWCLSSKCINYINQFVSKNPLFVNFFRTVDLPDEIFFQSIILNSLFKEKVVSSNLTYTHWEWNADHPSLLGKEHFEALISSYYLFARKFDTNQDLEILDMLDQSRR